MDFATAVKTCLMGKYATFAGRATRSEFWFFQLFYFVVALMLLVIDEMILHNDLGPLQTIWSIALLVPGVAVAARRLHDIDRSGWWQLLYLIPLIGWIVLIVWFATKSDVTDNRFGPPSGKEAAAEAVTA